MRKLAFAAVVISTLAYSANVFAQIAGPPAGPVLAGPPAPGPRPPLGASSPSSHGLAAITTVEGKIVKLQGNDDFVFDGFYMLSNSDTVLVKFPAHIGAQLFPIAKQNAQINVSGVFENAGFGPKQMRMISVTSAGKTLTDTPPAASTSPVQQTQTTGSGKITSLQTDREGRVNGVFIDSKTLLKLPPHVALQLGTSLGKGESIAYTGNLKSKEQGEVVLQDFKVVHGSTITVKGQQYLVR